MVADQEKLSLRMMDIVDLLVEADYWACDAKSRTVGGKHVEQAIEQKVYRSSLIEDRVQEFITNGTIKVDVAGAKVGQVNGLSVFDLGDYSFGRPSRITARVSMGRGQVINLEREIQKSGPSHSKGFLILQGYLNGKFAHRQPLSFAASLTFEQVYDEVDGDSASSTELYALLSAITDVPLKQGIAVTGSVNQLGEVQAIGGVNEKIEGFYAVCKARGLTGEQGVMIPKDNVHNLMLKPEVVEAVKRGRFHIYAVSTIEQGIELLTGMPAGQAAQGRHLRRRHALPQGDGRAGGDDEARDGSEPRRARQRRADIRSGGSVEAAGTPEDTTARDGVSNHAQDQHAGWMEMKTRDEVSAGGVVFRPRDGGGFDVALILTHERAGSCRRAGSTTASRRSRPRCARCARKPASTRRSSGRSGDIEYQYVSTYDEEPARVHKHVHMFLLRYTGGSTDDHDDEVIEARWVEIGEAESQLAFKDEQRMMVKARDLLAAVASPDGG